MTVQTLAALDHLHSSNNSHGNIRPEYIGKEKSNYNYLLMDDLVHQQNPEKTQMENLIEERALYMSPEFYSKLEGKNKEAILND